MTGPIFIDAGEVAARIGCSRALFLRQRQLLETQHGFPTPMPLPLNNRKWRAAEVDAWLARQGRPAEPDTTAPPPAHLHLLAEARRA